ncbi:hypothetical protein SAMN05444920_126118 [Nonomuraea solani]|uniref:Uncharacterized protein n=1 Tax=Nonomuraea solani TaxID=1144553 RepID=A0A1H6EX20_9ACTN|nr:hypothetical protein [Nonomuraea solani]SEH02460.1 hypothetical protein SAMN05444920_126118 [Nonomuraea solani]
MLAHTVPGIVQGPAVHDGVIRYAEIESAAVLPAGWTDEQRPGTYRLREGADELVFALAVAADDPARHS